MWPEPSASGSRSAASPAPSSTHLEPHGLVLERDRDVDAPGPGVLADVAQQLARQRQHQLVAAPGRGRLDPHGARVAARRRLLVADRAQRRLEAADLQLHRVQVEHHLADLGDGVREPVADAPEVLLVAGGRRAQPGDVVAEREQVLQRAVVQGLGDRAARAVLGVERERHQPAARLGLRGDLRLGLQAGLGGREHVGDRLHERGVLRADAAGGGGVAREHADRRLARADHDRGAAAHPELDRHRRAREAALRLPVGHDQRPALAQDVRGQRLVAEHLADPARVAAGAGQRPHDQRAVRAAPLHDADDVEAELAHDGRRRLAQQHLEGDAGEREPADLGRGALLALRARELGDVLGEAVDPLDGAAVAAHRHAAPAQDAAAPVGQHDGEVDLVRPPVAQRLRGHVAERGAVLLGDRAQQRPQVRRRPGRAQARDPVELLRPLPAVAGDVPAPGADAGHPLGGREPLARELQALVGAPAVGHVERDHRHEVAAPVVERVDVDRASRARGRPRRPAPAAAAARRSPRPLAATPPRPRRPRPGAPRSAGGRPARRARCPTARPARGR